VLSVVTPAYNEARNLPVLYDQLCQVLGEQELAWQWIVVDDHSSDDTFSVAAGLAERDSRVYAVRLSRNFGSHAAITCGLSKALGDCTAVMAADLQDPPEALPLLMEEWCHGAQIVWAARVDRQGERLMTRLFARVYYFLMRYFVGLKQIPATGSDFFLMDRQVVEALRTFPENHVNIFALIAWMGFRQTTIIYDKRVRLHGQSGWNLWKRLRLARDSIVSFTPLPLRLLCFLGGLVISLCFLVGASIIADCLRDRAVELLPILTITILAVAGVQILMMGLLGEYLWRAFEESRCRPRYLVEATRGKAPTIDL
jgi:dolichol-phosphate mannosyltransferase